MQILSLSKHPICLSLFLAGIVSPAHAATQDQASPTQSTDCISDQLPIADVASGKASLDTLRPQINTLASRCAAEQGWTVRQTTAASLVASAKLTLAENRLQLKKTPFAADLPDRMYRNLPIGDFAQLITTGNEVPFSAVLKIELAVTGSVLNDDGTMDKLTAQQSQDAGVPLGGALISLHIIGGFGKVFADPDYEPKELYAIMRRINSSFAIIERKLQ